MAIFLREITRDDIPKINCWRADRDLVALLGGAYRHIGPEVDEKWFDSYLSSRTNNVRLAVCLEENRAIVGVAYLLQIDWIDRSCEFSIQIGEVNAQGQGIGKCATDKVLEHAFLDLNLKRVYLSVLAENKRAIALYQKVHFAEEGRLRQAIFKNGRYMDLVQMAILREEFISRKNQ